jgi:hypothetical protein
MITWTDWQQQIIADNDLAFQHANEVIGKLEAELATLKAEMSQVEGGKGCCDHGCLIAPSSVGTNSGKCYCSQGKVRRYINDLKTDLAKCQAIHNCVWTQNSDGIYETQCGHMFELNEDTPEKNQMAYCCYCGKHLEQELYQGPPEGE